MVNEELSALEEDAYCLMEAAVLIDQARKNDASGKEGILEAALNNNLDLWIAIRSVISQPENRLSNDLKENLTRLSDFVAAKSRIDDEMISDRTLTTLININLQISEGLLESEENSE